MHPFSSFPSTPEAQLAALQRRVARWLADDLRKGKGERAENVWPVFAYVLIKKISELQKTSLSPDQQLDYVFDLCRALGKKYTDNDSLVHTYRRYYFKSVAGIILQWRATAMPLEERLRNGLRLLDENIPGWWRRLPSGVDLEVASGRSFVFLVGQAAGLSREDTYTRLDMASAHALNLLLIEEAEAWRLYHGFAAVPSSTPPGVATGDKNKLGLLWRNAINDRLRADAASAAMRAETRRRRSHRNKPRRRR